MTTAVVWDSPCWWFNRGISVCVCMCVCGFHVQTTAGAAMITDVVKVGWKLKLGRWQECATKLSLCPYETYQEVLFYGRGEPGNTCNGMMLVWSYSFNVWPPTTAVKLNQCGLSHRGATQLKKSQRQWGTNILLKEGLVSFNVTMLYGLNGLNMSLNCHINFICRP